MSVKRRKVVVTDFDWPSWMDPEKEVLKEKSSSSFQD